MERDELKRRIAVFCEKWYVMNGDCYDPLIETDWDEYGCLEAHLLRFCRSLLNGSEDTQWSCDDVPWDSEERQKRWDRDWGKTRLEAL